MSGAAGGVPGRIERAGDQCWNGPGGHGLPEGQLVAPLWRGSDQPFGPVPEAGGLGRQDRGLAADRCSVGRGEIGPQDAPGDTIDREMVNH